MKRELLERQRQGVRNKRQGRIAGMGSLASVFCRLTSVLCLSVLLLLASAILSPAAAWGAQDTIIAGAFEPDRPWVANKQRMAIGERVGTGENYLYKVIAPLIYDVLPNKTVYLKYSSSETGPYNYVLNSDATNTKVYGTSTATGYVTMYWQSGSFSTPQTGSYYFRLEFEGDADYNPCASNSVYLEVQRGCEVEDLHTENVLGQTIASFYEGATVRVICKIKNYAILMIHPLTLEQGAQCQGKLWYDLYGDNIVVRDISGFMEQGSEYDIANGTDRYDFEMPDHDVWLLARSWHKDEVSGEWIVNDSELHKVSLIVPGPDPTISFSPSSFTFTATEGGGNPANQTLGIWNSGGGTLNWSVSDDATWLSLSPTSGSSTGETDNVTVSVDISGLSAGTYNANITISATGATNTPQTVPVTLTVSGEAPPDRPYNPRPSDDATDVSITPTLRWDYDGTGTITYDVKFEKDDSTPDNVICDDITTTTCSPGRLDFDSHYYWQVVVTDDGETIYGDVWDFYTTEEHERDCGTPPSTELKFRYPGYLDYATTLSPARFRDYSSADRIVSAPIGNKCIAHLCVCNGTNSSEVIGFEVGTDGEGQWGWSWWPDDPPILTRGYCLSYDFEFNTHTESDNYRIFLLKETEPYVYVYADSLCCIEFYPAIKFWVGSDNEYIEYDGKRYSSGSTFYGAGGASCTAHMKVENGGEAATDDYQGIYGEVYLKVYDKTNNAVLGISSGDIITANSQITKDVAFTLPLSDAEIEFQAYWTNHENEEIFQASYGKFNFVSIPYFSFDCPSSYIAYGAAQAYKDGTLTAPTGALCNAHMKISNASGGKTGNYYLEVFDVTHWKHLGGLSGGPLAGGSTDEKDVSFTAPIEDADIEFRVYWDKGGGAYEGPQGTCGVFKYDRAEAEFDFDCGTAPGPDCYIRYDTTKYYKDDTFKLRKSTKVYANSKIQNLGLDTGEYLFRVYDETNKTQLASKTGTLTAGSTEPIADLEFDTPSTDATIYFEVYWYHQDEYKKKHTYGPFKYEAMTPPAPTIVTPGTDDPAEPEVICWEKEGLAGYTFDWNDVPAEYSVDKYKLSIYRQSDNQYIGGVTIEGAPPVSQWTVPEGSSLVENTVYYWQLEAHNADGWGDKSSNKYFKYIYMPKPTNLTPGTDKPAEPQIIHTTIPLLDWYDGPGVMKYNVKAWTYPGSPTVIDKEVITSEYQVIAEDGLVDGQGYKWQVTPYKYGAWGSESDYAYFEVFGPPKFEFNEDRCYISTEVNGGGTKYLAGQTIAVDPDTELYCNASITNNGGDEGEYWFGLAAYYEDNTSEWLKTKSESLETGRTSDFSITFRTPSKKATLNYQVLWHYVDDKGNHIYNREQGDIYPETGGFYYKFPAAEFKFACGETGRDCYIEANGIKTYQDGTFTAPPGEENACTATFTIKNIGETEGNICCQVFARYQDVTKPDEQLAWYTPPAPINPIKPISQGGTPKTITFNFKAPSYEARSVEFHIYWHKSETQDIWQDYFGPFTFTPVELWSKQDFINEIQRKGVPINIGKLPNGVQESGWYDPYSDDKVAAYKGSCYNKTFNILISIGPYAASGCSGGNPPTDTNCIAFVYGDSTYDFGSSGSEKVIPQSCAKTAIEELFYGDVMKATVYIYPLGEGLALFKEGGAWAKYKDKFYYTDTYGKIKLLEVPNGPFEVMVGAYGYKATTYKDIIDDLVENFYVELEKQPLPPGIYLAYWSSDSKGVDEIPNQTIPGVDDGTTVYMYVQTVGFEGKEAIFNIYEKDPWFNEFVTSKTGTVGVDGIVCVEWRADWQEDGYGAGGDPEFIFIVSVGTDNRESPELPVFKGRLDVTIDLPNVAAFIGEDITLYAELNAEAEFFDPNDKPIRWYIDLNKDNEFDDVVEGQDEDTVLGTSQTGCTWRFYGPIPYYDCGVAEKKISSTTTPGLYNALIKLGAGAYPIMAKFEGDEKYKPNEKRAFLNIGAKGLILTSIELDDAEVGYNKKVTLYLNLEREGDEWYDWLFALMLPWRLAELMDPNGRQINWYIDGEKTPTSPNYVEPGTKLGTSYTGFGKYSNGTASLEVDTSTLGLDSGKAYHIKAVFPGDAYTNPSSAYATLKVNPLKQVTLEVSTDPKDGVEQGKSVKLRCDVDVEGIFDKWVGYGGGVIHWYLDGKYLGNSDINPANVAWWEIPNTSDLAIGKHDIMAVYDGSDEYMPDTGFGTLWIKAPEKYDTWVVIGAQSVVKGESVVIPGNLDVLRSVLDTEANEQEIYWYIDLNSDDRYDGPDEYLDYCVTGIGWHGNGSFELEIGTSETCTPQAQSYPFPKRVCLPALEIGTYHIKAEFRGNDKLNGSQKIIELTVSAEGVSGKILTISRSEFTCGEKAEVLVRVKNTGERAHLKVDPKGAPTGWKIEPDYKDIWVDPIKEEDFTFYITPPDYENSAKITWELFWDRTFPLENVLLDTVVQDVRTLLAPFEIKLISPPDGSTVDTTTPTLDWEDVPPSYNIQKYEVFLFEELLLGDWWVETEGNGKGHVVVTESRNPDGHSLMAHNPDVTSRVKWVWEGRIQQQLVEIEGVLVKKGMPYIDPTKPHTMSVWVKSDKDYKGGAVFSLVFWDEYFKETDWVVMPIPDKVPNEVDDWHEVSFTFLPPAGSVYLAGMYLDFANAKGTIWYDDIRVFQGEGKLNLPPETILIEYPSGTFLYETTSPPDFTFKWSGYDDGTIAKYYFCLDEVQSEWKEEATNSTSYILTDEFVLPKIPDFENKLNEVSYDLSIEKDGQTATGKVTYQVEDGVETTIAEDSAESASFKKPNYKTVTHSGLKDIFSGVGKSITMRFYLKSSDAGTNAYQMNQTAVLAPVEVLVSDGPGKQVTYKNIPDGFHRFTVKAVDNEGAEDPTPAAAIFSLYNTTTTQLIRNPGFEDGTTKPSYWDPDVKPVGTTAKAEWTHIVSHSGSKSVKIVLSPDFEEVRWVQSGEKYGDIPLSFEEDDVFQLSLWVKTEGKYSAIGKFAVVFEDAAGKPVGDIILTIPGGDYDWTRFIIRFSMPWNADHISEVYLYAGYGQGTIWFDDLELIKLPEAVVLQIKEPTTTITAGPSGLITDKNVTFYWIGTDSDGYVESYKYNLQGQTKYLPVDRTKETKAEFKDLPEGDYTFFVQARDNDGNLDLTPASRSFVINYPPDTEITEGPPEYDPKKEETIVHTREVTFKYRGIEHEPDVAKLFKVRMDYGYGLEGDGWLPEDGWTTNTQATFSNLTDGKHTFEVKSRDGYEIEDPTPAKRVFYVDANRPPIIDEYEPGVRKMLLAGTGEEGKVFKATPNYTYWNELGSLTDGYAQKKIQSLLQVQIDDTETIYAGTAYDPINPGKVFKSTDGGEHWSNTSELANATDVYALLETVRDKSYIFAGTGPNGDVFKLTEGVYGWQNTGNLANAIKVHCLLEDKNGNLYAGTSPHGDIFKSSNLGDSWVNTDELGGNASFVYCLLEAIDGTIYAGTAGNQGRVFKSTDAGANWQLTGVLANGEFYTTGVWSLLQVVTDEKKQTYELYASTGPYGDVFKSTDKGVTWKPLGELEGAQEVYSLLEAQDEYTKERIIFAGTWPKGKIFKSTTGGQYWTPEPTEGLKGAESVYALIKAMKKTTTALEVYEGGTLVFSVKAHDPDGDMLTYNWYLDDGWVSEGATWWYEPSYGEAGWHKVKIVVWDGKNPEMTEGKTSVSMEWSVRVLPGVVPPPPLNRAPVITSYFPEQLTLEVTAGKESVFFMVDAYDPDPGDVVIYNWRFNDEWRSDKNFWLYTPELREVGTTNEVKIEVWDGKYPVLTDSVTWTVKVVGPEPVRKENIKIIDDFIPGTWMDVGYRGMVGVYSGEGATNPTYTMDKRGVTPAVPNNFETCAEINFTHLEGGWQVWDLHGYEEVIDVLGSDCDYLTFYIYSSEPDTTFDIGVTSFGGTQSKVPITNYLPKGAQPWWQKVDIPLSTFSGVNWSALYEFFAIANPNKSATIRVCQVIYTKQCATKLAIDIPHNVTTVNVPQWVYLLAVNDEGRIDFTWHGTGALSASGSATLTEKILTTANGRYRVKINDTVPEVVTVSGSYVSGKP